MPLLSSLLTEAQICFPEARAKDEALDYLAQRIAMTGVVDDARNLLEAIQEREMLMSTGIGSELAIPHANKPFVRDFALVLGVFREGVPFESPDSKPVRLMIMIAAPESKKEKYLRLLWQVTHFLKTEKDNLLACKQPEEITRLLKVY